jgi:hypothetical protein
VVVFASRSNDSDVIILLGVACDREGVQVTTSTVNSTSSALNVIRALLGQDGGGGDTEVPVLDFVRRMELEGHTVEEAIALLNELIDSGEVILTSRYGLQAS